MARKPQIRYFASRQAYYTQFNGQQHLLAKGPNDGPSGPTFKAAAKRFSEILAVATAETAGDEKSVRTVSDLYLSYARSRVRHSTMRVYLWFLQDFCNSTHYGSTYGEIPASGLKHSHVYAYLAEKREKRRGRDKRPGAEKRTYKWSEGNAAMFVAILHRVFRWAFRSGLLTRNPLAGIERPRSRSRGREALIGSNAAEITRNHNLIMEVAQPAFRPFLTVLANTGARPSEIANATASCFDPALGAFVYHADNVRGDGEHAHKTARKGKDRIIFLTGETLEIVRELVARHPDGLLFRPGPRHRGRSIVHAGPAGGWNLNRIVSEFARIRKRTGLKKVSAYSYRHTFATEWLKAGKPVDVLAAIMGNTPETIRKHYSHLLSDAQGLRRQLEEFQAKAEVERQNLLSSSGDNGTEGEKVAG
jgi:integrase